MIVRLPGSATFFTPLRQASFRLLLAGAAASFIGDGVYLVALAWQSLELHNSAGSYSLIALAYTSPTILFLLFGGALSDRLDRRTLMICSDLARTLLMGVTATLALTGRLSVPILFALVFATASAAALFTPAAAALVPDLVAGENLLRANALSSFAKMSGSRVAGPLLGGVLLALSGPAACFIFNGASFLASAAALIALGRYMPRRATLVRPRLWVLIADIREGVVYVRHEQWLGATILACGLALVFYTGTTLVTLPFHIKNELDEGARGYALVLGAGGAGAITGSFLLGQLNPRRGRMRLLYGLWILGSGSVAGYALVNSLLTTMVVAFVVFAACIGAGSVLWVSIMQEYVPADRLGRVISLDTFVSIGLAACSAALAGVATDHLGSDTVFVLSAIGSVVVLLSAFLLMPAIRTLESQSGPGERSATSTLLPD